MSARPTVIVGAIYTPPFWRERRWTATERREYRDGTVAVLYSNERGDAERVQVWDRRAGQTAGQVVRNVATAADLGAAVRRWRSGQRSRYIAGVWITRTADGRVTA